MGESSIEWTDVTWNPVVGCSRVSEGCRNCYAEKVAHRGMSSQHRGLTVLGKTGIRWSGVVRFLPDRLGEPLRWRKPRRIFVNSMSDLFHEKLSNEEIAAVFGVMAACPHHTFQVLTKRPDRMRQWFAFMGADTLGRVANAEVRGCALAAARILKTAGPIGPAARGEIAWPLPNVWLGVSVEDQKIADERIPLLLDTPAVIRWVSYEPALGPIDFAGGRMWFGAEARARGRENFASLDWIVVGGESGPGARPFDVAWARSTIAQCKAAGDPVFVKQLGAKPFAVEGSAVAREWVPNGRDGVGAMDDCGNIHLHDRKGGDWTEWPEWMRTRQFPRTGGE